MSEFYMDAVERWKQRGYEVTITGVVDDLCIDIKKGTEVHVHIASGPISARATMLRPLVESFENEFDGRALAQVNLWLAAVENEQAVVLYEKIKEAMKRLERVPLTPEIVKHSGNVTALEHLTKRLMGGDPA